MTKIRDVIQQLEQWAPPAYQASYDNAGLICGDKNETVKGILVCLDSIEAIIEEAIDKNCNLVVAHHPIVFSGLKSLTGKNYVERTLIKAIQNNIAIYAMHTNLDSVTTGVNAKIGDLIGVTNRRVLNAEGGKLEKLITFCPTQQVNKVRSALFEAGAGQIGNYDSCSFNTNGTGTFKPLEGSEAFVGSTNELHTENETKIEIIFPQHLRYQLINALKSNHPYEEVAFDIIALQNSDPYVGSGMIGELDEAIKTTDFFDKLKSVFGLKIIRHTPILKQEIKRIAWCGGAGSFLLKNARAAKADIFITGDFKYHEFFDHENETVIADIGHYESEQFTSVLIVDFLKQNFDKFAVHLSRVNTNPVNYY